MELDRGHYTNVTLSQVPKTHNHLLSHFILKLIILPRQARDKHRKS
jgi:hypothetical protein